MHPARICIGNRRISVSEIQKLPGISCEKQLMKNREELPETDHSEYSDNSHQPGRQPATPPDTSTYIPSTSRQNAPTIPKLQELKNRYSIAEPQNGLDDILDIMHMAQFTIVIKWRSIRECQVAQETNISIVEQDNPWKSCDQCIRS